MRLLRPRGRIALTAFALRLRGAPAAGPSGSMVDGLEADLEVVPDPPAFE